MKGSNSHTQQRHIKKRIQFLLANVDHSSISSVAKQVIALLKEDPATRTILFCNECLTSHRHSSLSPNLVVYLLSEVTRSLPRDAKHLVVKHVFDNVLQFSGNIAHRLASAHLATELLKKSVASPRATFKVLNLLLTSATNEDFKVAASILNQTSSLLNRVEPRLMKEFKFRLGQMAPNRYVLELCKQLPHQGVEGGRTSGTNTTCYSTVTNVLKSVISKQQVVDRLMKLKLHPGHEAHVSKIILKLCIDHSFFDKYYVYVAEKLCSNNIAYVKGFVSLFGENYAMIHVLKENQLRHLACFYGYMIQKARIPSNEAFCTIKIENLSDTTSSARAFLYLFFQSHAIHIIVRMKDEVIRVLEFYYLNRK